MPAAVHGVLPKASKLLFAKTLACLQRVLAYPDSAFSGFQPDQQMAMMQRRSGSLGVSPIENLFVLLKLLCK